MRCLKCGDTITQGLRCGCGFDFETTDGITVLFPIQQNNLNTELSKRREERKREQEEAERKRKEEELAKISSEEWFALGQQCYSNGKFTEAADKYRKAAELGHAMAQLNLGYMYKHGIGVGKNSFESEKWYGGAYSMLNSSI